MYVKLQSGEKFDSPNDEKVSAILERLHPEYDARATFYADDDEWLSVLGCVSDGFALSQKSAGSKTVNYCPRMLSLSEAKTILGRFIRSDADWKTAVSWKRNWPLASIAIAAVIAVVIVSILVLLLLDLVKWL